MIALSFFSLLIVFLSSSRFSVLLLSRRRVIPLFFVLCSSLVRRDRCGGEFGDFLHLGLSETAVLALKAMKSALAHAPPFCVSTLRIFQK